MRAWLRQHRQAFVLALRKMRAQGSAALLNALVIGIALALPSGGYALLGDLQALTQPIADAPQLSVFLRRETSRAGAESLGARLGRDPRVREAKLVTKEAALAQLRATEALADVIAMLGDNPLPDALVVHLHEATGPALDAFARELRAMPAVAQVQVDSDWARRFAALAAVARTGTGVLAAILAVGLIAVTFNTIRMQILTQRTEIEVSRLIGATDAFISRPFYYLGLLQGLVGGLVALAIVWASLAVLNASVGEVAKTYGTSFRLAFLSPADGIAVAGFSALIGWLGAYMSVSKYLREIDVF
ncbi:MAG: permease-like cell division protein FtsX [Burkholderiales bacterium]